MIVLWRKFKRNEKKSNSSTKDFLYTTKCQLYADVCRQSYSWMESGKKNLQIVIYQLFLSNLKKKLKGNDVSAILSWTSRHGGSSGEWSRWAMSSSLFWTSGREEHHNWHIATLIYSSQTDTAWKSFCVWLMVDKSKGKFAYSKSQSHTLF